MAFKSKLNGRALDSQSRELVSNLIDFFRSESDAGAAIIPITRVQERVADAAGISLRTVGRITTEMKKIHKGESSSFPNPRKRISRPKKVVNIDDFNKGVLKCIILNIYAIDKTIPSINTILAKFKEATAFTGCKESLRQIVKTIGFRYVQTKSNRKIIMELHSARLPRANFLQSILNYRQDGRPIVYLDETYINSSHMDSMDWADDLDEGSCQALSTGQRVVIVNVGGEFGFIPNGLLIFKSDSKAGEHHKEMSFVKYKKWLQDKLFPNLPPKSVLVIGNAPYHDVQVNKFPTSVSTNEQMRKWLRVTNIPFDDGCNKPELYDIILRHKPRFKQYWINQLLEANGHNVLRLPQYHHDLNPFELVWTSLKQYVAQRNVNFELEEVRKLSEEFFSNFSREQWKQRWDHTTKSETDFWARERAIDDVTDAVLSNLKVEAESSESDDSESE